MNAMEERKSFFVPILIILSGVLLQLKALGLLGETQDGFLDKAWPILILAAALDMFFTEHRLISALVLFFTGAALLCSQFLDTGWSSSIWRFFLEFWPLLVILYGIDSIFTGRSLISSALIIVLLIVAVYAIMATTGHPILKNFSLPGVNGKMPDQTAPSLTRKDGGTSASAGQPGGSHAINYVLSNQPYASIELEAASGKIQMQAGNLNNCILAGTITLDSSEHLQENSQDKGNNTIYILKSQGEGSPAVLSDWNLSLSPQRQIALTARLTSGYAKIDLRGLDLSEVLIENKRGPIDVMTPVLSQAPIQIHADNGDIRVYIPANGFVDCTISGTDAITYPPEYTMSAGQVFPISYTQEPVKMTIQSNQGAVQIIQNPG